MLFDVILAKVIVTISKVQGFVKLLERSHVGWRGKELQIGGHVLKP